MLSDVLEEVAARLRLSRLVVRTPEQGDVLASGGQHQRPPAPGDRSLAPEDLGEGDVVVLALVHRGRPGRRPWRPAHGAARTACVRLTSPPWSASLLRSPG